MIGFVRQNMESTTAVIPPFVSIHDRTKYDGEKIMPRRRQEALGHRFRKRVESLRLVRAFGRERAVVFLAEGLEEVRLPRTGLVRRFSNNGLEVWRKQQFAARPNHEVLLRMVVHRLFVHGVVSRQTSIVDIGAWIGDNALVWARMLEAPAFVYAIDPSEENIDFAQSVAKLNGIDNIRWHKAVCSDTPDQPVGYRGNLDHAKFYNSEVQRGVLRTATLDAVVGGEAAKSVGLLHVDVEGFELAVLQGATKILELSRPIVLFEGHLREHESCAQINQYLAGFGYTTFMLNEVLPGCQLDCRNFLAVPNGLIDATQAATAGVVESLEGVYPATLGPLLLPIPASWALSEELPLA